MNDMISKENGKSLVCELSIPLTSFCLIPYFKSSTQFPTVKFEVLSVMSLGDGNITFDLRVSGESLDSMVEEGLRHDPSVSAVEDMHLNPDSTVFRVETISSPIVAIFQGLRLSPMFPLTIQNGILTINLATSIPKMASFIREIRKRSPDADIVKVSEECRDGSLTQMTDRQKEIFRMAMAAGWWEVPRRTDMRGLAELLSISKSSESETLSTAENRVVHEFALGPLRTKRSL